MWSTVQRAPSCVRGALAPAGTCWALLTGVHLPQAPVVVPVWTTLLLSCQACPRAALRLLWQQAVSPGGLAVPGSADGQQAGLDRRPIASPKAFTPSQHHLGLSSDFGTEEWAELPRSLLSVPRATEPAPGCLPRRWRGGQGGA